MESFREDFIMAISYKRLWKMLIDKDMKKKELWFTIGGNVNVYTHCDK